MVAELPTDLADAQTEKISVRVPKRVKEWYKNEAYERSSPDERVTPADLQRQALAQYADRRLGSSEEGGDDSGEE